MFACIDLDLWRSLTVKEFPFVMFYGIPEAS